MARISAWRASHRRLAGALEVGDVAEHAEPPAIAEHGQPEMQHVLATLEQHPALGARGEDLLARLDELGALGGIHLAEVAALDLVVEDRPGVRQPLQGRAIEVEELERRLVEEQPLAVGVVDQQRVRHLVEHGLQGAARALELLLVRLELGDVAIGHQQAAVVQLVRGDLERESVAAGAHERLNVAVLDDGHAPGQLGFDVGDRAKVAARELEADDVGEIDGGGDGRRIEVEKAAEGGVVEQQPAVRRVERRPVAHVVEHRAHGGARALLLGLRLGEAAFLLDDVGEVAMHGQHAAAGQRPVGDLDGAAGDGAPPLGRLARQVEARDAAGDPALQAAGQRLERAVVAAQCAMADDVLEGRQPLQHLVRHVVQARHRLVLVDPAAVAFVEQRAVAHVVEHGAHGLLGEGDVAMRIVEALGEVVRGEVAGDLRARALALDMGEQADDDDEAQHDRRQPQRMPIAVEQHQDARHRQHQRGGGQREGAPIEAARWRAADDQAERQRP